MRKKMRKKIEAVNKAFAIPRSAMSDIRRDENLIKQHTDMQRTRLMKFSYKKL